MLSRILTAAAIALVPLVVPLAGITGPQLDKDCPRAPGLPANCTPLVACIPEAGIYFTGRAFGWNAGSLAGDTNAGFACTGEWTADGPLGMGQAVLSCDNDLTGTAFFSYQDADTGTVTGFGAMSNGMSLRVWSGRNIRQFITKDGKSVDAQLVCGAVQIPLG